MTGQRLGQGMLIVVAATLLAACATSPSNAPPGATFSPRPPPSRPTSSRATASVTPVVRASRTVFGHSVMGRDLMAFRLGPVGARRRVLVIGVIHGNEAAGEPLALGLLRTAPPASTELVVVPNLNPDGVIAGTRQNARGVDLNRNFTYRWRRLGRPGDQQYAGAGPLSEPESGAMAALIQQLRPTVTVWFHQPEGVVDVSGGSVSGRVNPNWPQGDGLMWPHLLVARG